jgi:hypothetical protein
LPGNDQDISVPDSLVNHGIPIDPQSEITSIPKEIFRYFNGFGHLDGLNGSPRRHDSEKWNGFASGLKRNQFQGALLVFPWNLEITSFLYLLEMLEDGVQGLEPEIASDFLVGWRIAMLIDVASHKPVYPFLCRGESHGISS